MMCGNENLRTPNLFVRKLIMFLFLVPFILINGDNGVHGHHDEIATATANTFSASNLVHFQLAHEDNEQQSNGRSRRGRRRRRRQQHVMPDNRNVTDAAASFKSEFQPNNVSSSTEEHKYRNSSQDEITIEYRDGYENNKNHTIDKNGERILSRRRRYLIFPPGSSVQIVYDTYHPILGYSNYLILGITAALAWELPSKPVYLDEELRESYQMGNLPLAQRKDQNISNVTYTSTNKHTLPPSNTNSAGSNTFSNNYYYTNVPSASNKNPFNRFNYAVDPNHPFYYNVPNKNAYANSIAGQSNKLQYYLSYADQFMKEFKKLTQKDHPFGATGLNGLADTLAKKLAPANKKKFKVVPIRKHLVHPAFKKRSTEKLDKLEEYDLKLHRATRHKLYQQIETFLKTQGSDGMDCVLKTLCETGQRDTNEKPGSMIVELLRAVFTLPEGADRFDDPRHRMYDRAHQSQKNCHEMFPACVESIWGPKFHY